MHCITCGAGAHAKLLFKVSCAASHLHVLVFREMRYAHPSAGFHSNQESSGSGVAVAHGAENAAVDEYEEVHMYQHWALQLILWACQRVWEGWLVQVLSAATETTAMGRVAVVANQVYHAVANRKVSRLKG
jgi:hypothetical protein